MERDDTRIHGERRNVMARLLIVDDDEEFRESFAFTLKRMRYEIVESDNALDAQHKFTQYTFDMVITDMRMPKKPGGFEDENAGLDLLRDIKKSSHETQIMVMTAYGKIENAVEAMKEGACDYIIKLFSTEEIVL